MQFKINKNGTIYDGKIKKTVFLVRARKIKEKNGNRRHVTFWLIRRRQCGTTNCKVESLVSKRRNIKVTNIHPQHI